MVGWWAVGAVETSGAKVNCSLPSFTVKYVGSWDRVEAKTDEESAKWGGYLR